MPNNLQNRRGFIAGLIGVTATPFFATSAFALSRSQAETLIDRLSSDILTVIDSGKTGNRLYSAFERIFTRYADVPIIARSSLGAPWRSATAAQKRAYTKAFSAYLSRKYGKRFREFVGAKIEVTSSRTAKNGFLVESLVTMKGQAPFIVEWQVSDKSGKNLMFNMYIEGINMLQTERAEIGAMYDKSSRNMDKLIAYLKKAG